MRRATGQRCSDGTFWLIAARPERHWLRTNRRARVRAHRSENQFACGWIGRVDLRAAVMLHLRARYVSKAAILTALALCVSAENRSPA